MANTLPPVPYRTPLIGPDGLVSMVWLEWYRELLIRVGGNIAPTNSELNASAEDLQTTAAALQSRIEDLGQGRAL